ncbi:MAG: sugar transferase [Candidatus Rifleibacteriota bacterium]
MENLEPTTHSVEFWRFPFFIEARYTQGKSFILYKFLSSAANGQKLPFGNLIKQIYLDELPQIFHIANGDMLIVGPRPNPEPDYSRIIKQCYYAKVLQKAGLTGGVQVAKGSSRHGDLSLDEQYMYFCLENNLAAIVIHDMKTLWLTIKLMSRAEGI